MAIFCPLAQRECNTSCVFYNDEFKGDDKHQCDLFSAVRIYNYSDGTLGRISSALSNIDLNIKTDIQYTHLDREKVVAELKNIKETLQKN